jgi:hypothetical protein
MKKIISFLTNVNIQDIDDLSIKSILIDIVTIGVGTVMLFISFANTRVSEEGAGLGSSLITLGILIKIWKKELRKK